MSAVRGISFGPGWQIRHSRLIRAIPTTLRCLSNRQHGNVKAKPSVMCSMRLPSWFLNGLLPGSTGKVAILLKALWPMSAMGVLVRVNKQRDALPSAARYVYHPAAFRLPCRDVGVSRVQMPRGGDV